MTARALGRHVAGLARRHAAAAGPLAATAAAVDAGHAARLAFLGMVPEDLRMAVGVALRDRAQGDESLHEWAAAPFAPWAVVPAAFQFPRALVEWVLAPPRPWFLGHGCGRCGLAVPLLLTPSSCPDPPPASLVVFPTCPACGGRTSSAATYRPEPPT